jgi:hypothetical protein
MASQSQYDFFKLLYDEENLRYNQLEARAKFYITVQTLYLGAIAFKTSDINAVANLFQAPLLLYIGVGFFLVLGLLFTVMGVRIRNFEGLANGRDIIEAFGPKPPQEGDFLRERLADFVVATERNSKVNDDIAKSLAISAWLLFAAIVLHFISFILGGIHYFRL